MTRKELAAAQTQLEFYGIQKLLPIILKDCKKIKENPKYIFIFFSNTKPDQFGSASINIIKMISVADAGKCIMIHDIRGRYNLPKRIYNSKLKLLEKQEQQNNDMLLKLVIEVQSKKFTNEEGDEFEYNFQQIETPEKEEIQQIGIVKHKTQNLQQILAKQQAEMKQEVMNKKPLKREVKQDDIKKQTADKKTKTTSKDEVVRKSKKEESEESSD